MSPRRIKAMASSEGRKEQLESSDTPDDQAQVTRQKQPSVDSTQRPQVPPQNISLEDLSARSVYIFTAVLICSVTPQDVTRVPHCCFSDYKLST